RLHLERVKLAEVGDLIERERGVLDQPDGGCFRHQRRCDHGEISSALRPPSQAELGVIDDDGSGGDISTPPPAAPRGGAGPYPPPPPPPGAHPLAPPPAPCRPPA